MHSELDAEMVMSLEDISQYLSSRDPHVSIEMDNKTNETCQSEMQMRILTTSWLNLENLFHLKLQRINQCSNARGSGALRHRYSSLLHEINMNR